MSSENYGVEPAPGARGVVGYHARLALDPTSIARGVRFNPGRVHFLNTFL